MDQPFTHLDERGSARMVDVTGKVPTTRRATARCRVRAAGVLSSLGPEALAQLVVQAEIAGTRAAKHTSELVPLCHSIRLDGIAVRVETSDDGFAVEAVAQVHERTGVEMEALTACAVAALTVLAGLPGGSEAASVEELELWEKTGGRSGTWQRPAALARSAGDPPGPATPDGARLGERGSAALPVPSQDRRPTL